LLEDGGDTEEISGSEGVDSDFYHLDIIAVGGILDTLSHFL